VFQPSENKLSCSYPCKFALLLYYKDCFSCPHIVRFSVFRLCQSQNLIAQLFQQSCSGLHKNTVSCRFFFCKFYSDACEISMLTFRGKRKTKSYFLVTVNIIILKHLHKVHKNCNYLKLANLSTEFRTCYITRWQTRKGK